MQNTQIEYGSEQRMPVVLPEMEELLPPLSAEQFSALESDIPANGCYNPVIVVVSRVGPVDKSKNSAETRRGPSRIINPETEKDGIYHPLKV